MEGFENCCVSIVLGRFCFKWLQKKIQHFFSTTTLKNWQLGLMLKLLWLKIKQHFEDKCHFFIKMLPTFSFFASFKSNWLLKKLVALLPTRDTFLIPEAAFKIFLINQVTLEWDNVTLEKFEFWDFVQRYFLAFLFWMKLSVKRI